MKQQIEKWCEENGYALVDIKRKELEPKVVHRIAEKAVFINKINKKVREQEVAFSRFLACAYLYEYMPAREVCKELGVSRSIVNYAYNQDLFNIDHKYLKPWQSRAVTYFKEKTKEAEELCN